MLPGVHSCQCLSKQDWSLLERDGQECRLEGLACICMAVQPSDQALCEAMREIGTFCPLKLAASIENKTKGQKTASLFTSLCRSLPTAKQRYLHPNSSRRCAETQQMGSQDYPQGEQLCSSVHHVLCHLHHWEVSPVCCCPDSLWHFPDTQKLIDWHLHPV